MKKKPYREDFQAMTLPEKTRVYFEDSMDRIHQARWWNDFNRAFEAFEQLLPTKPNTR